MGGYSLNPGGGTTPNLLRNQGRVLGLSDPRCSLPNTSDVIHVLLPQLGPIAAAAHTAPTGPQPGDSCQPPSASSGRVPQLATYGVGSVVFTVVTELSPVTTVAFRTFSSPRTETLYPLAVTQPSCPQPLQPLTCSCLRGCAISGPFVPMGPRGMWPVTSGSFMGPFTHWRPRPPTLDRKPAGRLRFSRAGGRKLGQAEVWGHV